MMISRLFTLLSLLALTACSLVRAGDNLPPTLVTNTPRVQTTPVPTLKRDSHSVPTAQPSPSAIPDLYRCEDDQPTHYTVIADMDYPNRAVMVHQSIDYINRTGESFAQLVLNVKPNLLPGVFQLNGLFLEGDRTAVPFALNGQQLFVDLPKPLSSGCRLKLQLEFHIQIPKIDIGGVRAYQGYLGYSERQTNLGLWLPVVAARRGQEWIMHEEIPIGEQDVLESADWDVTLNVTSAPDSLAVAAPGRVEADEAGHWRFTLNGARDFSVSLGENFHVGQRETKRGVEVELYSFDDAQLQTEGGLIDTAAFALDSAVKSLEMYEDLYGTYPYERLVIVQGDFPDGMEFSGLVFVGGEYFRGFNGPTSYLMIITVHEVSHQWWYDQVGNDQALYPWLDEALATYSEYAFIEEYYPGLKDWWWNFRVNSLSPDGFVDSTVYEFTSRRAYINAVYLRGVRMLNDLRDVLGTEAFFDWLRRYAEAGTGQLVTPDMFWSLLSAEQYQATTAIRERYLHQPQIISISTAIPS